MDFSLIAQAWWMDIPATAWVWIKVMIGLGLVIFVHELGHFVVAKLCGVKCEKFYLGFDIGGLKLCKITLGETEYGIGIFPLGGYVKMLGQEDNPARLREEIERAKAGDGGRGTGSEERVAGDGGRGTGDGGDAAAAERALYDPRSYLAKSVPKRMAIISAGVVMNVIFAFVAAMIAYGLGVPEPEPVIGSVFPGEAAWRANLMPSDRVEEISGRQVTRWDDLVKSISLGDIEQGVRMVIHRAGEDRTREITVYPDRILLAPSIGAVSGSKTTLDEKVPVAPGSAAASARPKFKPDDHIVAIGGEPIKNYRDLRTQLALHSAEVLKVTVERRAASSADAPQSVERSEEVAIELPPAQARDLGMVMEMGPITAIQQESPAAAAGIQPGDVILRIDGKPPEAPVLLPEWFRRRAETSPRVTLSVQREGEPKPVEIAVTLRRADRYETPREQDPVSVPSLGIAYRVGSRVERVTAGGPAAAAGVKAGDVIAAAQILLPDRQSLPDIDRKTFAEIEKMFGERITFGNERATWPFFFFGVLQNSLPGSRVAVTLEDGRDVTLEPVAVKDWFLSDRGLVLKPDLHVRTAGSVGEAVRLGAWKTWDALTFVFRVMEKLVSGQVSPKAMGGPVEIFRQAGYASSRGMSQLLTFLTMLSANLALLNFLPIPVLDGGHMVFLAYEGIFRKSPNEKVQTLLMFVGLLMLLALLLWVCALDFRLITRN